MTHQPKTPKKLLIMYIDCTDTELARLKEDLFFALGCVTGYQFLVMNKRFEALSKEDLMKLMSDALNKFKEQEQESPKPPST